MDAIKVKLIGLSRGGGGNLQPNKDATPTEQTQIVQPDPGYDGLRQVTVDPIPDEYADVSCVDAGAGDVRVGKIIVGSDGETITGTMPPQKPEQVKTATPTTSPQSVTPDTGYALSRVDVGEIPSEYADVSDVTATAETVLTGSDFVDASGALVHGACEYDADTRDATATAGQIEVGATAYVGGAKVTGTKPIRTTDVEIDSLSPVPIPAGSYDGTASAKIDDAEAAKIVPENIKKDVEIFGRIGAYEGADTLSSLLTATLTKYVNNDYVGDGSEGGAPNSLFSHCWSLQEIQMDAMKIVPSYFLSPYTAGTQYPGQKLKKASFASATEIGSNALAYCPRLQNVDIHSAVIIRENALAGSGDGLTLYLPHCTTIYDRVFRNSGIVVADMPVITDFGSHVPFQGCRRLTNVNLPLLENIGAYYSQGAFDGCSALTVLDFPKLKTTAGDVFNGCTLLATLILRSDTVVTIANTTLFNGTPFASNGTGGTLYCPQNLISQYEQATNWSVILAYSNNQILPIEGSPYEVTP